MVSVTTSADALPAALATTRRAALDALCRRFGVQVLYVFGSRASGVLEWLNGTRAALEHGGSDVDVGVKTPGTAAGHDLSLQDKVALTMALEDLLGVARVDLVTFVEAGAFLAVNVIRGERLYSCDSRLADEFDLYVLRRAADLAPFERQRQAQILGAGS
jgi:predicted nucleotidyltransferase